MRRRRGVSLQSIIDRTKIASLYLRAIESEQFQVLPGRIYSVNYIRQYAEAIDYDADTIPRSTARRATDHVIETSPQRTQRTRYTAPLQDSIVALRVSSLMGGLSLKVPISKRQESGPVRSGRASAMLPEGYIAVHQRCPMGGNSFVSDIRSRPRHSPPARPNCVDEASPRLRRMS